MSLAVVDASVLAVFYVADDPRHALVVERLKVGDLLFAPAHWTRRSCPQCVAWPDTTKDSIRSSLELSPTWPVSRSEGCHRHRCWIGLLGTSDDLTDG